MDILSLILSLLGCLISCAAWYWAKRAADAANETNSRVCRSVAMSAQGLNELLKHAGTAVTLRFDEHGNAIGKNVTWKQDSALELTAELDGTITKRDGESRAT